MAYYGHSGENLDKSDWQTLKDHLVNVSEMAGKFAEGFGAKEMAEMAGILHDIGKYSNAFQSRLEGSGIRVNHSTAGAKEAFAMCGKLWGTSLAYAISGHHGGIPNGGKVSPSDLHGRLQSEVKDYSAYKSEIFSLLNDDWNKPRMEIENKIVAFQMANLVRMVYSCLVDADFLDTESVLDEKRSHMRKCSESIEELFHRFEKHMDILQNNASSTSINSQRRHIYDCCYKKGLNDRGLFSLTVPTGGGKTLSSMAFALRHAKKHGLKRIIYVIPFTSIIEQNADVFRKIFGDENVLEHHSSYQFENFANANENSIDDLQRSLRLATENWESPVVVTTNVQFFESLFSNKPSKCRKLHNIANSVIILDEAQMLPFEYLKPAVSMLGDFVMNYHSSVVLCTATQPSLNPFFSDRLNISEIIDNQEELTKDFKRVSVYYIDMFSNEKLKERILSEHQVLCIVNTRRHAAALYRLMEGERGVIHLSARMCPAHRREALKRIKTLLSENAECRVVSTQLVEAGVDIDFPVVYRASAGLDSIAQAAGRCNREGKLKEGKVFVFEPEKMGMPGGWLSSTAARGREIIRSLKANEDVLDSGPIQRYFKLLYWEDEKLLDKKRIMERSRLGDKDFIYPFSDIAKDFKLIENDMVSVIVPYGLKSDDLKHHKLESIFNKLRFSKYKKGVINELQPYTVQVYRHEFKKLIEAGALEQPVDGIYLLVRGNLYKPDMGLEIPDVAYRQDEELVF
ncbi:MAG: CRISPR-associated helicase Cas3' [Peptostreptococcaceae bacterium]|nr:CRISPR-associated helicase Cas3' [Peptostreptococcaceae bacterium]